MIYSVKRFALHLIIEDVSEINNNSGNKNDSIASAGILPQGDIPDSARLGYLLDSARSPTYTGATICRSERRRR